MSLPILRNVGFGGMNVASSSRLSSTMSLATGRTMAGRSRMVARYAAARHIASTSSTPSVRSPLPLSSLRSTSTVRNPWRQPSSFSTLSSSPSPKSSILSSLAKSPYSRRTYSSSSSSSSSSSGPQEDEPTPNTASGRLKAMFKKYGWYSLGMYLVLGFFDCGLVFLAVHALGADKIEPVFDNVIGWYRTQRYGAEEAEKMRIEGVQKKAQEAEEAQRQKEMDAAAAAAVAQGQNQGKEGNKSSEWNFKLSKTFWAELALAYAIHKTALLPVRAGLTVAWTPKLVAWLTRRGWVGKGGLTRAANHAQDKVRNASDRVKERVKRQ